MALCFLVVLLSATYLTAVSSEVNPILPNLSNIIGIINFKNGSDNVDDKITIKNIAEDVHSIAQSMKDLLTLLGHRNTIPSSSGQRIDDLAQRKKSVELRVKGFQCTNLGWYKLAPVPRNWEEANSSCRRDGAHLAVINSPEEATTLSNMITKSRPAVTNDEYSERAFIGIHDKPNDNDEWSTIFNESLDVAGYNSWQIGHPSVTYNISLQGNVKIENCGVLDINSFLISVPCKQEYQFICEYPKGPKCLESIFTR